MNKYFQFIEVGKISNRIDLKSDSDRFPSLVPAAAAAGAPIHRPCMLMRAGSNRVVAPLTLTYLMVVHRREVEIYDKCTAL